MNASSKGALLILVLARVASPAISQTTNCQRFVINCPSPSGTAVSAKDNALDRSNNRLHTPAASDMNNSVTLKNIYDYGVAQNSFDTANAVTVTGYVYSVKPGAAEACNCGETGTDHVDTHMELVVDPARTDSTQRIGVEVSPKMRYQMSQQVLE